jgi:hypothetical protein
VTLAKASGAVEKYLYI